MGAQVWVGAFAVIRDPEGRVLLGLRRDLTAWDLPGGGAEPGESPWAAVVREVREEVGLEAEVVALTGVYWKPARGEVVFCFACTASGEPGCSDEVAEVGWFPPDALPDRVGSKQRQRIRDACAAGPGPAALRVQDGPSVRVEFGT